MRNVGVRQNGKELGTVQFRGISSTNASEKERRLYKCNPKACVPKEVARMIADRLTQGITSGNEKDYEWST
jgi:hypothetical protein